MLFIKLFLIHRRFSSSHSSKYFRDFLAPMLRLPYIKSGQQTFEMTPEKHNQNFEGSKNGNWLPPITSITEIRYNNTYTWIREFFYTNIKTFKKFENGPKNFQIFLKLFIVYLELLRKVVYPGLSESTAEIRLQKFPNFGDFFNFEISRL